MKELALYNLKEGMVLAKDITTPSGQVVLEKGKELTKQSILRLSFYNIKSACIVDGEEKQAAPKSYSQKIKTSQKFQSFQVDHTIVLSQIRVSFEGYVNEGRPLDTAALLSRSSNCSSPVRLLWNCLICYITCIPQTTASMSIP